MQPKDSTSNEGFKGFTNHACPFLPCHEGVRGEFNCLFCYCPLIAYECPGPYEVFTDRNGVTRKDCSACTLPHNGYRGAWNFIQKWLEKPVVWNGEPQKRKYRLKPVKGDKATAASGGSDPVLRVEGSDSGGAAVASKR